MSVCRYLPEVGCIKISGKKEQKKKNKRKKEKKIEMLEQPTFWYFREQNVSATLVNFDLSRFRLRNVYKLNILAVNASTIPCFIK